MNDSRHHGEYAFDHRQPHRHKYDLPITDGTIKALDLRQIKTDDRDFGLMAYDPGYLNTASTRSSITYIDGDDGILRYRGYPIEQLAEHSIVPGGRLPADPRRTADRVATGELGRLDPPSHVRP